MSGILRLAVCAWDVAGAAGPDAFIAKLDARAAEAAAAGANLLVCPEYAVMEVAAGLAGAGDARRELAAVCDIAPAILGAARMIAARHGIWLVPGTLPWRQNGAVTKGAVNNGVVTNRAALIAPDGRMAWQDKLVMTRFEAETWGVRPGAPHGVFATQWGRIGIAICYDVEFPALVRAQVLAGAWLILAPSCTDGLAGFNRVRLSARARALENQCFVAVAPTVGLAPMLASVDENHGAAAIYGPVDRGFAADGVVARGAMDRPGLIFADLDPARLDAVRADGAVRNYRDWPDHAPPCDVRLEEQA